MNNSRAKYRLHNKLSKLIKEEEAAVAKKKFNAHKKCGV